ncbi:MAG: YheC/YheD family protein [Caloramator sp.]|nr:YheC/YheD family protein [Caloramator sp.]
MIYRIEFNEDMYASLPFKIDSNEKIICFGNKNVKVKLKSNEGLKNKIILPKFLKEELFLKEDLLYQVVIGDSIKIGPLIGILVDKKTETLKNDLDNYIPYFLLYSRFYGVVFLFALDGIDFKRGTITGVYFNPFRENNFIYDTFPFPYFIFRRIGLNEDERKYLSNNALLYNSYYFDKWEFYNLIKDKINTPETKIYNKENLQSMLNQYKDVFLKKQNGSMGIDIYKIVKYDDEFMIKGKFDKSYSSFKSLDDLIGAFNFKNYLVQMALKPIKFENRCSDIRVVMQKDDSLKWKLTSMIVCLGKRNGICSNYQRYGYTLKFEEFFVDKLGLGYNKTFKIKKAIEEQCKRVCSLMDTIGNFCDVGIDVIVDEDYNIWIIEANKRHDHRMVLSLNDKIAYYQIKNNPIKFGVKVSGFELF